MGGGGKWHGDVNGPGPDIAVPLPTQMVLVESNLLPWEHSQLNDPATLRQTPLTQGLDSHSSISETERGLYVTAQHLAA